MSPGQHEDNGPNGSVRTNRTDQSQLARRYDRLLDDRYSSRWSLDNAGNRESLAERLRVMQRLIHQSLANRPLRVLDLGCGGLTLLPPDLNVDFIVGVDLLFDRLRSLRERGDATPTVNADGAFLPFPNGAFDAVVMSTMLSSVLDEPARLAICSEVSRILNVGGAVLWYDFRVRSIGNSATRPIRRSGLRRYFSDLSGSVVSLTVLPPLARRLGRAHRAYAVLARAPFLRTHLAACLVKP